jgi:hypothetical protein
MSIEEDAVAEVGMISMVVVQVVVALNSFI